MEYTSVFPPIKTNLIIGDINIYDKYHQLTKWYLHTFIKYWGI